MFSAPIDILAIAEARISRAYRYWELAPPWSPDWHVARENWRGASEDWRAVNAVMNWLAAAQEMADAP